MKKQYKPNSTELHIHSQVEGVQRDRRGFVYWWTVYGSNNNKN
jgi:hypothetical protein